MKKLIIICVVLMIALQGFSQSKKFSDIIGTWHMAGDENTGGSLQIIDSATIILSYMGEKKNITDYKIDFTKSPIWFDFTAKDSSSTLVVKSLLDISGNDILRWQIFVDEERPRYFSTTKGELLYLKKTRNNTDPAVASN